MRREAVTFAPIREWPGASAPALLTVARFRTTPAKSLELLEREIARVNGRLAVVFLDVPFGAIKQDGKLYADARPTTSRVLVTFTRGIRGVAAEVRFACHRYRTWADNLHAVALTLEALRAVDRHGATAKDEHLVGFTALPSGASSAPPAPGSVALSPEQAARVIASHLDLSDYGRAIVETALLSRNASANALGTAREARGRAHPDAGGDADTFARVQAAYEVLETYHRGPTR
jgi:hypothetical protein